MMNYVDMAREYMINKLKEKWVTYMKVLDIIFDEGHKNIDEEELGFWVREEFLDNDAFLRCDDKKKAKEMVLANVEYVFEALAEHRCFTEDEEIVDYICTKDWSNLDTEARYKAVEDVCGEVGVWLKREIDSRYKAKKPTYTYEYTFVCISRSIMVQFYDLTPFQLSQIMANNPEFIIANVVRNATCQGA